MVVKAKSSVKNNSKVDMQPTQKQDANQKGAAPKPRGFFSDPNRKAQGIREDRKLMRRFRKPKGSPIRYARHYRTGLTAGQSNAESSNKWNEVIYDYEPCGTFRTGVQYASIMDALDGYIQRSEEMKDFLNTLGRPELERVPKMIEEYCKHEWEEITTHFITDFQREEFGYMFATANVILWLQYIYIIEKRYEELGVDGDRNDTRR